MKTFFKIFAAIIAIVVGGVILYAPSFTVDVPEDRVRTEIADRLPITVEKNGVTVLVTSAEVDFLQSNAVSIQAEADVSGFGFSGSATTDVTSSLRYEAGNFYLADISLENLVLDMDEASESRMADSVSVAKGLFAAAKKKLEAASPGAGDAMENLRNDAIEKAKPSIRQAVDSALTNIPVYSLNNKGMKFDLAAAALEEVYFTDDAAHATLSPGKALLRIIIGLVLIIGTLIIGIAMTAGTLSWGYTRDHR